MSDCDVLVVGAGPTGLVLALWMTRMGLSVRIIDQAALPGTSSRALAVQARTLELYRQLDLTNAVLKQGRKVESLNFWVKGEHATQAPVSKFGLGLTPYPFLHIFPQDAHEQMLIERLAERGVVVERPLALVDFDEDEHGIRARLQNADGELQECQALYLAGCDGARSTVRGLLGTGFPGGTYRQLFYVADVAASGPAVNGQLHVDLDEADFLAVFPLADSGHVRLIGTVRDERADRAESLGFNDVGQRALAQLQVQVDQVNWFSTYHVHHRVTEHMRRGRTFLVGDAAHVHSPAGGQGMNTGIGDAINLAWKLASVIKCKTPDNLLDSYEIERLAFARQLVATTDKVFDLVTADGRLAKWVRTKMAPQVLPRLFRLAPVRNFMFRTVSQIGIHYRLMPLSFGQAGQVHGGDRLPWVQSADNYGPLANPCWQVHLYGELPAGLAQWCAEHGLPLHVYDFTTAHAVAGLAENALYLIRPDNYVALAEPRASVAALEHYFDDRDLHPCSRWRETLKPR